jgi:putative membrane protein
MQPPRWRREGQEPDVRFTLANERTFLAWIRTALALLAGGVLLEQFAPTLQPREWVVALGVGLAALAALLSALAYSQWRRNEIAMRMARPLPHNAAVALLSAALLLAAAVLVVLLLLR